MNPKNQLNRQECIQKLLLQLLITHGKPVVLRLSRFVVQAIMIASLALFLTATCCVRSWSWESELFHGYPNAWKPGYSVGTGYQTKFLHDFSHAGYRRGESSIPSNSTWPQYSVGTEGAIPGDSYSDHDAIQAAINKAAANGKGIVTFAAGRYNLGVAGGGTANYCLLIPNTNIILRGAVDANGQPTTTLYCFATSMRDKAVILATPGSMAGSPTSWYGLKNSSAKVDLTSDWTTITNKVTLSSVTPFQVNDWVLIYGAVRDAFVNDHYMNGIWGLNWDQGISFYRQITNINTTTKTLSFDTTIRYPLKTADAAFVAKLTTRHIEEVGVENFKIQMKEIPGTGWEQEDYSDSTKAAYQAHNAAAIRFHHVVNGWIRNVKSDKPGQNTIVSNGGNRFLGTTNHIVSNGIELDASRLITVRDCDFRNPQYKGGGGNGHMVQTTGNDNLIYNCTFARGRHNMSLAGMAASGNVFYKCTSILPKSSGAEAGLVHMSDFHQKLSIANLMDSCVLDGDALQSRNRGLMGGGHGATSSQSVFWNTRCIGLYARPDLDSKTVDYAIHSDQFGQGYVIGTQGAYTKVITSADTGRNYYSVGFYDEQTGGYNPYPTQPAGPIVPTPAADPADYVEGVAQGETLWPPSLYVQQLKYRNGIDFQ
jgi:hypothetical protein